jgi:hypothetical protein
MLHTVAMDHMKPSATDITHKQRRVNSQARGAARSARLNMTLACRIATL